MALFFSGFLFLIGLSPVSASDPSEESAIKLPDDLSLNTEGREVEYETFHAGGRLERLTVRRQSGLTETYENRRDDALWTTEENNLGEIPNVRKWTIGSW